MDDFQPGFWGSLDPLMDAECRIPSGSCIKLEYSALAEERRYLVYPDFRFRGGVR